LNTGELKVVNLHSPSHTAVRIAKKRKDLNAKLNDFEMEILSFAITYQPHFHYEKFKLRFMDRYHKMWLDNQEYLSKFFMIGRDIEMEAYFRAKEGVQNNLYYLLPKILFKRNTTDIFHSPPFDIFKIKSEVVEDSREYGTLVMDDNTPRLTKDFMFYIRNIGNNELKSDVWNKLRYFYKKQDYIDTKVHPNVIDWLGKFTTKYPAMVDNLSGMKLSEQLGLIKKIFSRVPSHFDYETAISILEYAAMDPNIPMDDWDCILLELSVRTKVKDRKHEPVDHCIV